MKRIVAGIVLLALAACGGGGGGDPVGPSPSPSPTPTPPVLIALPASNDLTLWGRIGFTDCTILAPSSATVIDSGTRDFSYEVPAPPLSTYTVIDQLNLTFGADTTVFTDIWHQGPGSWYVVSEGSVATTVTWEVAIPYWNATFTVGTRFGTLQDGGLVWVRGLDAQGVQTNSLLLDATITSMQSLLLSGGQLVACYLINWDRSIYRVSDGRVERDVGVLYFRPDVGIVRYAIQHHVNGVWVHSRSGALASI